MEDLKLFTLHCTLVKNAYVFADKLKIQHPDNQNIEAKIRQQIQFLRDKGMIEFLERGHYRKLL